MLLTTWFGSSNLGSRLVLVDLERLDEIENASKIEWQLQKCEHAGLYCEGPCIVKGNTGCLKFRFERIVHLPKRIRVAGSTSFGSNH